MVEEIIRIERLDKSFSGVPVLKNINLDIKRGEILGIIGENGAGKSTLMKILAGIYYPPTAGSIYLHGKITDIANPIEARRLGISLIPQEFNLIRDLPVYNNIFLGAELMKNRVVLDNAAMRRRTIELLSRLGVSISPDAQIENLSAAQKQMLEISKALAFDSEVLIMDEPTTMLTHYEIDILFRLVRQLRENGMTIVYISHKLKEVKALTDRVAILRDGEVVHDGPTADMTTLQMAQKMVGRELSSLFPPKNDSAEDQVVFEIKNVSVPGILHDVSFALRRGEVLGLFGLVGAGRTEIAETVLGLRRKSGGEISINGKSADIREPRDAVGFGISYLSEDRQGSGIITSFSVAQNTTLVSLPKYSSRLFHRIDKRTEHEQVDEYIREFRVKTESQDKRLENLSGGNQQKISLAKSIDTKPGIFIIDEPTRGVDVSAKHEIYVFINKLVKENRISCLLISSELEEIIGMCNRVVVMREGAVTGELGGDAITEENVMALATGVVEDKSA
ncbi:MAG: sugar ABC transporter ATP-binding protein [Planctomycetota bacterium]|jgi:ribose transport system ATP-binding protein|nr:sugar ABC transporter ATP-binding protein [Planctomycetota bacterium]